ncbi:MAG: ZIP family metal transporter [Clostridiales bacterium]|jgi:ZIP family zinc transporter|nr:ZIP family metal transporter [Clostridiales bacterium]
MDHILFIFLILLGATWIATTIGAALVMFFKRSDSQMSHIMLGFAAGVMIVAAFWQLLQPAIEIAEERFGGNAIFPVLGGFLVGCLTILLLDMFLAHRKKIRDAKGEQGFRFKKSFMMVSAISIHNLPEGFAVGVLIGTLGSNFQTEQLMALLPVIIAIALHNLPEGTVVSVSFRNEGLSKFKSFFLGQVAGLTEFIASVAGFLVVVSLDGILPYALAFAAGAMIWVAVHELIPECQKNKERHPYYATIGIIVGIAIMLALSIFAEA